MHKKAQIICIIPELEVWTTYYREYTQTIHAYNAALGTIA